MFPVSFCSSAEIGTAICAELTTDVDFDEYELESANECRRILLDAGCDPTMADEVEGSLQFSFLSEMVFRSGTVVSL